MQPSPAIGLSAIGQIALSVADAERSIAFYRDQLGMRLLFQVPQMGFFDCGGVRLMLSALKKPQGPSNSVIYFRVPDIQAAFESFRQRGVAFEGEPHVVARMPDHDLWMAFFRDPDRNLLALMAELPR
jgi:methylmalonyl-CoA/ethylmalonyl-CoA epimerase